MLEARTDVYMPHDRRACPRLKVSFLAEVYMGTEILFATAVDISEDGIGIMLPGKFNIGERMNLRISSSLYRGPNTGIEKINICLKAEVIWINKSAGMYRAGLSITDIQPADMARLKENIRQLQTNETA
jgi:hypothetical protein